MQQFTAKVLSNKKIAPNHYLLSFKAGKLAKKTKPGQFFNIKVDSSFNPLLRRPFGAHKISKNTIEILYKVVGKATKILSSKKKGDTLDIIGPLGTGFKAGIIQSRDNNYPGFEKVLLVAGGHGIAPLYALAKAIPKTTILIGAKTKKHIVCEKEFKKLGCRVHVATEDGTKGHRGLVTDLLEKRGQTPFLKKGSDPFSIYACGPKPMLKAVAKFAERHGIACQVSLEEYIACGIGTCLGCAVETRGGYKLICKDGPVFNAEDIIW